MRKIGKDCIQKRIKSIEKEEVVPNDVLTHILQSASKSALAKSLFTWAIEAEGASPQYFCFM